MQAIHWAADNCDVDALRRELERGVDPDIIEGTWTPLQFLPFSRGGCSAQALQCYRLLLENGADVNVRDAVDDTKLHDASLTNNAELVALLLEAGKSDRRGRLGELRTPPPRPAHRHAHAKGPNRRTPPLAPPPVAAEARPARGPPEDRRVRVPCGLP